jgi:ABC-type sugar transport system ATPase subunit
LPGGEHQRVAVGRAIIQGRKVFLMDEPQSNLNATKGTELRQGQIYENPATAFVAGFRGSPRINPMLATVRVEAHRRIVIVGVEPFTELKAKDPVHLIFDQAGHRIDRVVRQPGNVLQPHQWRCEDGQGRSNP